MPQLVRNARAYLLSLEVSDAQIDSQLTHWKELRQDSLEGIYRSFLVHAKNRRGMPNTIGDISRLKGIFFNFDPLKVISHYSSHTDILNEIIKKKIPTSGAIDIQNNKSHWVIYAKSALASGKFLSRFQTAQDFHDFVQSFYVNEYSRLALPLLLKEEIFGFGFALACDFLKESGHSGFIKPDTHVNDICRAANITCSPTDFGVFKDAIKYCEKHDLVPYEFDKLIWLVGSGNFYLHNLKVPASKSEFISKWLQRKA